MKFGRKLVVLVVFSGIFVGSYAATGVVNDKMSSDPSYKENIFAGNLTVGGYYDVQVTTYLRNVKGLLWGTKVTYTGKTFNIQGYVKDLDSDFNYSSGTTSHVRPDGIVDQVAYTVWPYIWGSLSYIPVSAFSRDSHQGIGMRPKAKINSSNLGSNINIHSTWTFRWHNEVSAGQTLYVGVGNWALTDITNVIW
jgi:hypothetical protein